MKINGKEMILIITALKDSHEKILENKENYENWQEEADEILALYNKLLLEE